MCLLNLRVLLILITWLPTIEALKNLRDPRVIAKTRKITLEKLFNG